MTWVVNIKRERCDVRIDRSTRWGNPFRIGIDGDRDQVCDLHAEWIQTQPHLLAALHKLKGKRLGCWCKPRRCHGDTLKKLIDALPESPVTEEKFL